MRKQLAYLRLSQEKNEGESYSISNQKKDILAAYPKAKLYIDNKVSGWTNISDPKTQWNALYKEFLKDPSNTDIILHSYDRLGRKKGLVAFTQENILESGGRIIVVRENKIFDSNMDNSEDLSLYFQGYANEAYRKEITKKTRRAIDELKKYDYHLGRKPKFTQREVNQVKELYSRGLGYNSIGKIVRAKNKDGEWINTSPRVIKKMVTGEYITLEEHERHNEKAKAALLLGIEPTKEDEK